MKRVENVRLQGEPGAESSDEGKAAAPSPPSGPEDPRVIRALEEYLAALEMDHRPDRQEFLARHAAIAHVLAGCLDGLEFMRTVNPERQPADGSATTLHPTAPLGDFCLLREIGRGGMGIVYEAEQMSLGRRVALKVLPFAAALDSKQLQRFKNEAQAAAHLHHQNIVPIHFVGCERGVHFYAMQFIEGQSLAEVIHELRRGERSCVSTPSLGALTQPRSPEDTPPVAALSTEHSTTSPAFFRSVVNLGVQAAEALAYAHQMGVIHRDIKPANLLVGAGGRLWITDFGLAHCQSQPGLTMTGDVVGTLRYMSPEQALGKRVVVDARTDVYSLGATLYGRARALTRRCSRPGRLQPPEQPATPSCDREKFPVLSWWCYRSRDKPRCSAWTAGFIMVLRQFVRGLW